ASTCTPAPPPPGAVVAMAVDSSTLADTTAVLTFENARASGGAVSSYEIRYREGTTMSDQEFSQSIRAGLVVPGAPGSPATITLAGLKPATSYVVGVRAVD